MTLAIGVTGCGSAISGQAEPGMTPANLAGLDTGPYQSAPQVYRPKISYNTQVFHIESRRMMSYLVSPYQIDPDMKLLEAVRVIDQSSFRSITGEFPESYAPIAERNHLIGGALTTRSNGDLRNRKFMTISIMRFPSDAAARAAATEFDQDSANSLPGRHRITLDGVANATASSVTDAKGLGVCLARPVRGAQHGDRAAAGSECACHAIEKDAATAGRAARGAESDTGR
ncbi:hypothetical protein [Nocardia sp. NPDC049526]|uniref:DUF7373 family lipoprotein n=1 Tax=Nocardia sp. NPDC049526 TaxID=3364316 RepID=UPI003796068E